MQLSFGGSKTSPGYTALNQSLTSAYNKMKSITSSGVKPMGATVSVVKKTSPVSAVKPVVVASKPKVVTPVVKKAVVPARPVVSVSTPVAHVAPVAPVAVPNITGLAKKSSDAYYTSLQSGYARTRDDAIAELARNYNDAVAQNKMSITDAQNSYSDAVKQIDAQYYKDAQLTNTTAFSRGLGNSQQMAGLMLGDASRRNTSVNDSGSERDKQIQAINARIQALTSQKNADVLQENKDYNYNITQARADANKMYYDALASNAVSSGGGSGGGGGSYSNGGGRSGSSSGGKSSGGSSSGSGGSGGLPDSYKQYLTTKTNTALDQYNTRALNLGKKSVVQTKYVNPIVDATHNLAPAPGMNPNLSAYDKWKILKTDFGL
jgi:hypothetical protein